MCEESRVNYIKCRESDDLKCTAATTQGRFMGTIGWAGSGGRGGEEVSGGHMRLCDQGTSSEAQGSRVNDKLDSNQVYLEIT